VGGKNIEFVKGQGPKVSASTVKENCFRFVSENPKGGEEALQGKGGGTGHRVVTLLGRYWQVEGKEKKKCDL